MTSREIAELTGKAHFNVLVDVRKMLSELGEDELKFQGIYRDSMNREQVEFHLDRELTEVLLTGYSAVLRRKVIARWRELESGASPCVPQTLSAALRLAADQAERIEVLAIERDRAIDTKAQIGSRREATAMASAASAKREAAKAFNWQLVASAVGLAASAVGWILPGDGNPVARIWTVIWVVLTVLGAVGAARGKQWRLELKAAHHHYHRYAHQRLRRWRLPGRGRGL